MNSPVVSTIGVITADTPTNSADQRTAYVVEGTCLATIQAASEAELHKSRAELTRMIDNHEALNLSADGFGMALAIREAVNAALDAMYAR